MNAARRRRIRSLMTDRIQVYRYRRGDDSDTGLPQEPHREPIWRGPAQVSSYEAYSSDHQTAGLTLVVTRYRVRLPLPPEAPQLHAGDEVRVESTGAVYVVAGPGLEKTHQSCQRAEVELVTP